MNKHITETLYNTPWPMHPPKLREIEAVIRSRFFVQRGVDRPKRIKSKAPAAGPASDKPYDVVGRVALLRLTGVISRRMNLFSDFSGGTSTETFGRRFDAAVNDNEVKSIVIHVDSPGGTVYGVPELADRVFAARKQKRVVAVVDPMMASAAYWIGSAAQEISLTPSGHVGSIGVYVLHEDYSEAEQKAGIKSTYVYAGRYKVEGNPFEPLSDEARAAIQADVDHYYTMFVNAVARNRGTTPDAVRNGYGEGRVLNASNALGAGLVDRIATLEQILHEENQKADRDQFMFAAAARQKQAEADLD